MSAYSARETRARSDDFERSAERYAPHDGLFGNLSATSSTACFETRCASRCSALP